MIQYFKNSLTVLGAVLFLATFAISCVDSDSKFGSSLIPPEWEMKTTIDSSTIVPATYIFSTDSVGSVPMALNKTLVTGKLFVGSMIDPLVGRTSAQGYCNYTPQREFALRNEFFGEEPVIDSMYLGLSLSSFTGDTLTGTEFELYEVKSGNFKYNKVYNTNFDMKPYLEDTALLKFTLKGPDFVRLALPMKFAQKFLINNQSSTNPYANDTVFHEKFKGLYLKTKDVESGEGCIFGWNIAASSMLLYYHNEESTDTVALSLLFRFIDLANNQTRYNTHFAMSQIDNSFADPSKGGVITSQINDNTIQTEYGYIQGLGGLGTAVVLPKEQIEKVKANAKAKGFSNVAIHSAELIFDVDKANPENYLRMFSTLAPYKTVSKMEFVTDYKPFDPYAPSTSGGDLSMSLGKYRVNITSHVQRLFLEQTSDYTIQLYPALNQHMYPSRTVIMGSASQKPPRLILTYTMIK